MRLSFRLYLMLAVYMLLFAFALRVIHLSQTSLWIDDILTYNTLAKSDSIEGFVQGVIDRKIHVPAYFAVSRLYPDKHNDFSVRYPNVLWGLLAIAILMQVVKRFYGRAELALLAGLILVVHPYFILLSREARPYPMSMMLTLSASYLFLRWMSQATLNRRQVVGLLLVLMLAYLTHYATLLLIPAQLLTIGWQVWRKRLPRKSWGIGFLIQGVAVVPTVYWEVFVSSPNRSPSVLTWIAPLTPGRLLEGVSQLFIGTFTPHMPTLFQVIAVGLGIIGFLVFMRHIQYSGYWLLLTIIPLIGLVIVSQIRPLFYARYLSITQPMYLIVIVLGWWQVWERLKKQRLLQWTLIGLIGLSILSALTFSAMQFSTQSYARREWKQAFAYIEEHAQSGDWIVVHPSYIGAPRHYITRDDLVIMPPDDIITLTNTYFQNDNPPANRMWFVITPESFRLHDIAHYYGTDLELYNYTTHIFLVEQS
jgi:uncharacterized membrane protein